MGNQTMGNQTYKGPGIIESILEFLCEANESSPITKTDIHRKLVERFPNRPAESMLATVKQQVPNKLRVERGLLVQKNERGYWIAQNGSLRGANSCPSEPQLRAPQTIRIDPDVWQALQKKAVPFLDTPNDVLRRLLGLPAG